MKMSMDADITGEFATSSSPYTLEAVVLESRTFRGTRIYRDTATSAQVKVARTGALANVYIAGQRADAQFKLDRDNAELLIAALGLVFPGL